MSTIGWVIDHYDKITLSSASMIELCIYNETVSESISFKH